MQLLSKTIKLRLVEEVDAEFIISLRTNVAYNTHLSGVSDDINAQIQWIKDYKKDELSRTQFYFIIERNDGVRCGTVRIYDIKADSFSWGSWILNEEKTRYSAIESAFLVYSFGFDNLGFKKSHFEVRKGNEKVISFHKKMGAQYVGETEHEYLYEITKQAIEASRQKLARMIQ
ncbi:GNAT family N-acetyltransferase [Pseudomonas mandelii]|uniref:GNAT family N-acetyltransferase n=1 Tax=Pseudomonas mandelii TaxID=75612 RepID=UPI00224B99D4|nr:GNAT family N-acetyltransferase [Pseudomonas mandelii]MCX2898889.1 GNAT family N-acetyltransferase [Pseudomonas mandelii]